MQSLVQLFPLRHSAIGEFAGRKSACGGPRDQRVRGKQSSSAWDVRRCQLKDVWIDKNEQLELFSPLVFFTQILQLYSTMADIPTFHNLSLERHGNVFVLTMQKPPENRLNSTYCQEMIRAYRTVERLLGPDSEGAVITRGNDAKFWCTVCTNSQFS